MTQAVIMTLFAAFLWAMTSHIDKFMVSGIVKSANNIKTLMIFSTLVAGIIISPIWLVANNFSVSISTISLISVISSAFIYTIATYLYFKALEKTDASVIVVCFQLIPIFSYILALIFFKENLTINQIIGSILIILSAILISLDFEEKKSKKKLYALIIMTFSSFLYAVYYFLFDIGIRHSSYNSCAFYYQVGFIILGLILISIKSYRASFLKAIKKNGKIYCSLNIANEVFNLGANLLVNLANVTIPLALANVLNSCQGVFVFILGVLGVKLLPKYFKESLNKTVIIQKTSCIILSIIGLIIMFK